MKWIWSLFYYISILPTPSKAFVSFNPTLKALYFCFTDIVSDYTVADIDTDMTVFAWRISVNSCTDRNLRKVAWYCPHTCRTEGTVSRTSWTCNSLIYICNLSDYAKRNGVDLHITPHMFRHTFATALMDENVNIRYIQQLLGHSSITTTQIYTLISTNSTPYCTQN